jgi:hypothetical protein
MFAREGGSATIRPGCLVNNRGSVIKINVVLFGCRNKQVYKSPGYMHIPITGNDCKGRSLILALSILPEFFMNPC